MTKRRKVKLLGPACPKHGEVVDHEGEKAILRPIQEGEDIRMLDAVRIEKRNEDGTLDLVPLLDDGPGVQSGPAQVATKSYRDGWDRVFQQKKNELN